MSGSGITGIRPAGTRALLVEAASFADVAALHARLKAHPLPGQLDVLAAAATVLVSFAGRRETAAAAAEIESLQLSHAEPEQARTVTIDTVYDGGDLAEVARLTGLSAEGVVNAHTGTAWLGGFGGFAPGFTYLTGGDPVLNVPRRNSPRTAVPAGSVALAGDYSAVYPRESPGGWQLIGRTNAPMWDLNRKDPALIRPGDHVIFHAVRELASTTTSTPLPSPPGTNSTDSPEVAADENGVRDSMSPASPSEERASSEGSGSPHRACEAEGGSVALRGDGISHSVLEVRAPGLQSLIQDLGRPGFADLGVSASGAADTRSARQANRLVGNRPGAAVIENLLGGLELTARGDTVLALAGAELPAAVVSPGGGRDRPAPLNSPFVLLDGETLALGTPVRGVRTYLAARGGIAVAPALGSRSTDTMSGIGPPPLAAGTRLPVGAVAANTAVGSAEPSTLAGAGPGTLGGPGTSGAAGPAALLRITAGPRQDWFSPGAAAALTGQDWLATSRSNRIGVRLETDPRDPDAGPLRRTRRGELASEGVVPGSLQVPPSGLPVLFLADHPVTGGYPVVAAVVPTDLPVAAQLPPGHRVRFVFVDPDTLAPISPRAGRRAVHGRNRMKKVLIANRGEIAVRVARACADAGIGSVAVYSDPDADALHVRLADEAYPLHGSAGADTYLNIPKLIDAARTAGADAVHPGYGFLSENADFAQAVLDAGLTWIGPAPQAIRDLGNKVTAREIAVRAGAPLVPGTDGPAENAEQVRAFAAEHGLPVAIKAAFGGGGRGMKVARRMEDVEDAYESAVREAVSAFGRGECFAERFLDQPRHVEAQVLADTHGNVVVVGTRDCSLQRRNQKLVEEAPAPFLTDEQRAAIHESAKAVCREAGYTGAGTVEYLVSPDGLISFLEVNTRLQVEHPVTEETTGVDLVREQFRIADGLPLSLTEDPAPHGHAFEFRLNAEDPARGFLPGPGRVEAFEPPTGPGLRMDSGVRSGSLVPGDYDSLMAKLIVWGKDRPQALRRARAALDELVIRGLPTVLPFHRAVVRSGDFTRTDRLGVHTTWIETEFTEPLAASAEIAASLPGAERETITIDVDGRAVALGVPAALLNALRSGAAGADPWSGADAGRNGTDHTALVSPMAGNLVKWTAADGAVLAEGDPVAVLEAMKMETTVRAHRAGTLSRSALEPGAPVGRGDTLGSIS